MLLRPSLPHPNFVSDKKTNKHVIQYRQQLISSCNGTIYKINQALTYEGKPYWIKIKSFQLF